MANIISKPTGSKAVQVVLGDGSRRSIGIGKVPKKAADTYRIHLEHLVGASIGGYSIPSATAEWLTKISHRLRTRLEELDLVGPEAVVEREQITIDVLLRRYLSEIEVKPRTVDRYRNQTQFMQDFFGKQVDISELTNGDGERFLKWLKRKKKKEWGAVRAQLRPQNHQDLSSGVWVCGGRQSDGSQHTGRRESSGAHHR